MGSAQTLTAQLPRCPPSQSAVSSLLEPRPSKGGAGSKTAVKAVVSGFLGALPWLRKQGWAVEGEV